MGDDVTATFIIKAEVRDLCPQSQYTDNMNTPQRAERAERRRRQMAVKLHQEKEAREELENVLQRERQEHDSAMTELDNVLQRERQEHDGAMAEERQEHDRAMAEEREEHERNMGEERQEHVRVVTELENVLQQERRMFAAERTAWAQALQQEHMARVAGAAANTVVRS